MNIRTKKRNVRRRNIQKKDSNVMLHLVAYSFILVLLFCSVFGVTLYLNGQSEKMNKEISIKDIELYKLQREIQNLNIKIENYSRKNYIVSKIKHHSLGLKTPYPFQVVHIELDSIKPYDQSYRRQLAFNTSY